MKHPKLYMASSRRQTMFIREILEGMSDGDAWLRNETCAIDRSMYVL